MMNKYVKRLTDEWIEHGKIIIGCDYDDTLKPWKFTDDNDCDKVIDVIKKAQEVGAYLVIFTACDPDRHKEIYEHCETIGLKPDTINKNPIQLPYGNNGKIYANVFLDDRGGLLEALDTLSKATYGYIGHQRNKNLSEMG